MNCIYIDRTDIMFKKCKSRKKYGNFCKKHRSLYLLKDNIIVKHRYTNDLRDYKRNDYINSILEIYPYRKIKSLSKQKLADMYLSIIDKNLYFENHQSDIIKIQSLFRRKKTICDILRGIGYFYKDLCKNSEDFYYMTTITETPDIYIFTYRDLSNSIWFFDMRSFYKLLQNNNENPYTRETIDNKRSHANLSQIRNDRYHDQVRNLVAPLQHAKSDVQIFHQNGYVVTNETFPKDLDDCDHFCNPLKHPGRMLRTSLVLPAHLDCDTPQT